MKCCDAVCFALLFTIGIPTFAADGQQNFSKQAEALKLIRESANDLCATAPTSSSADSLAVNGKIQANVKGLVAKVADLGAGAAAEYKNAHTEGVLQKDLAPLISQSVGCKERVFNTLVDRLLPGEKAAPQHLEKSKSDAKGIAPPTSQPAQVVVPPAVQSLAPNLAETGPIIWTEWGQFFVVTGGGPAAQIVSVLLQGTSTAPISIKDAYAVSGLTGHKQNLMMNVAYKGYYDVDKVDIPAQARVWLELVFKPPMNVNDFLAQWGRFGVTITYNDFTYRRDFSEVFIRQKLKGVSAGELGPHVTPK